MKCPVCNYRNREPEGEEGTHACPHCGWEPGVWGDALAAARDIVAALEHGTVEDAASAIRLGMPALAAFCAQEGQEG